MGNWFSKAWSFVRERAGAGASYIRGGFNNFLNSYWSGWLGNAEVYQSMDPMEISTIRSGVQFIAHTVGGLQIKAEGGRQVESIRDVLETMPTRILGRHDFLYSLVQEMLVHGNAFAYIRDDAGFELIPSCIVRVEPFHNSKPPFDTKLEYVVGTERVEASRILHFAYRMAMGVGFSNMVSGGGSKVGISYAEAYPRIMKNANQLDTLHAQLINNTPAGVITSIEPSGGSDTKADQEQQKFEEQMKNSNSRILILPGGRKFVPNNTTPQALQYLEARTHLNAEIMRSLALTPKFLNFFEKGAGGSIDEQTTELVIKCIAPLAHVISQELTLKLLTLRGIKGKIELDTFSVRKTDLQSVRSSVVALIQKGVISRNEGRIMIGKEPIKGDGGDELMGNVADLMPLGLGTKYWNEKINKELGNKKPQKKEE